MKPVSKTLQCIIRYKPECHDWASKQGSEIQPMASCHSVASHVCDQDLSHFGFYHPTKDIWILRRQSNKYSYVGIEPWKARVLPMCNDTGSFWKPRTCAGFSKCIPMISPFPGNMHDYPCSNSHTSKLIFGRHLRWAKWTDLKSTKIHRELLLCRLWEQGMCAPLILSCTFSGHSLL